MEFLNANDNTPVPTVTFPALPTVGRILCCLCGASIIPNEAAMCVPCLHLQHDLSSQIETNLEINQCKKCSRWQVGPIDSSTWIDHELESNGLLMLCLKRIPELQNSSDLKILNSTWIWTEPHSKRLKFFIDLEKMLYVSTKFSLQQKVVFEFVIKNKQCIDCIHDATDHNFQAVLQLRQFTFVSSYGSNASHSSSTHNSHNHKKLLYTIESFCTQHGLFEYMTSLQIVKDTGFDFYFKNKQYCEKVMHLLTSHFPIYCNHNKASKKLVSRNIHTGTARYEHTFLLEILPYNKDDLVLVPPVYSGQFEVMVVQKTTSVVHCVQPRTAGTVEIHTLRHASQPLVLLATNKHLVPFIVLDVQPCTTTSTTSTNNSNKKQRKKQSNTVTSNTTANDNTGGAGGAGGGVLAEIVVAKESDLGENDLSYTVYSHLGHLLAAGDTVLGYDLQHMVFGLEQDTKLQSLSYALPDVILVRKLHLDNMGLKKQKKKNTANRRIPPWRQQKPSQGSAGGGEEEVEAEGEEVLLYEEELEGLEEVVDEEVDEEVLAELLAMRMAVEGGGGGSAGEEEEGEWEDVQDHDNAEEEEEVKETKKKNNNNSNHNQKNKKKQ